MNIKIRKYIAEFEFIFGVSHTHILKIVRQENAETDCKLSDSDLKLPPWKSQVRLESALYKGEVRLSPQTPKNGVSKRSEVLEKSKNHDKYDELDDKVLTEWSDFE